MKLLFIKILTILCLLSNFTFTQPSITWQRLYDGPAHRADNGFSICHADEGNFYIAGNSNFNIIPYWRVFLLKIDPQGDTIWTREIYLRGYSGSEIGVKIINSTDNGCVLTAEGGYKSALKVDQNGNTLWYKTYDTMNFYYNYDIRNCWDGGYIICGTGDSGHSSLIRLDQNGNKEWEKLIDTLNVQSVEVTNDHAFIIASSGSLYPTVVKYDSLGNILWRKEYSYSQYNPLKCIRKISNGYILGGSNYGVVYFIKIDINGNIYNIHTFPTSNIEHFESLRIISDSKYVFSSFFYSNNTSISEYNRLVITDTLWNIIHQKFIYPPHTSDYEEIMDIQIVPNGDFIFVGSAELFGNPAYIDIYAIRTDSLLNFPPNIIGLKQIENTVPSEYKLYQNYPNPFNPSTKIKFSIPPELAPTESGKGDRGMSVQLTVYDLLGRKIATLVNEQLKPGTYEVEFDGTNFASGVYFYRIEAGDFAETRKMTLLK